MNTEKAREFFSSYFEGSLDSGLRQTFERKLNTDAELQAEYRAFERTMNQLSSLREVETEIPFDLHEKIQARLDLHVFEQKRSKKAPFALWFRTLGFAGLAALAIFGTIKAIGTNGDGKVAPAGVLTGGGGSEPKVDEVKGYQLKLDQFGSVTVSDAFSGMQKGDVVNVTPEAPYLELGNTGNQTEFVKVEIASEKKPVYVAVPAKSGAHNADKDETVRGAAMRLAQQYGKPIVLHVEDPLSALAPTTVSVADPVSGISQALGGDYRVELRGDVIWVQQH